MVSRGPLRAPPVGLGLAAGADVVHEVLLGQRLGGGGGFGGGGGAHGAAARGRAPGGGGCAAGGGGGGHGAGTGAGGGARGTRRRRRHRVHGRHRLRGEGRRELGRCWQGRGRRSEQSVGNPRVNVTSADRWHFCQRGDSVMPVQIRWRSRPRPPTNRICPRLTAYSTRPTTPLVTASGHSATATLVGAT